MCFAVRGEVQAAGIAVVEVEKGGRGRKGLVVKVQRRLRLGRATPTGSSSFKCTEGVTRGQGQQGQDQGSNLSPTDFGHVTSLSEPQLIHL